MAVEDMASTLMLVGGPVGSMEGNTYSKGVATGVALVAEVHLDPPHFVTHNHAL